MLTVLLTSLTLSTPTLLPSYTDNIDFYDSFIIYQNNLIISNDTTTNFEFCSNSYEIETTSFDNALCNNIILNDENDDIDALDQENIDFYNNVSCQIHVVPRLFLENINVQDFSPQLNIDDDIEALDQENVDFYKNIKSKNIKVLNKNSMHATYNLNTSGE